MPAHPEIPKALLESPSFQLDRLRRRTRDFVDAALAEHRISLREYWLLTYVVYKGPVSQGAIKELLAVDPSDVVRLVDTLEQRGWVKRKRNPKDRRRHILVSSSAGATAQRKLAALVAAAEDRALDESTSKQLKHLRKLATAIIAADEEPSS